MSGITKRQLSYIPVLMERLQRHCYLAWEVHRVWQERHDPASWTVEQASEELSQLLRALEGQAIADRVPPGSAGSTKSSR